MFRFEIREVSDARWHCMNGRSWHSVLPCPSRSELCELELTHRDFAGGDRTGCLIVAQPLASEVVAIFRDLYALGFPIERMRPVCEYGGDDNASMNDNNTSAFNCRLKVGGSSELSAHGLGRAIDINPRLNPYVRGAQVLPPSGYPFADIDRSRGAALEPGMLAAQSPAVQAFCRRGWRWGGNFVQLKDWHHFEKPLPLGPAAAASGSTERP